MGRILSAGQGGASGGWRIWLAPLLMGLPASLAITLLSLPAPQIGQVTGVITPTHEGLSGFFALLRVDPDLRLVDQRWGGRLIFVVSKRQDFPRLARRSGVLLLFDARSVGCGRKAADDRAIAMTRPEGSPSALP